jgi:lysine 6-dehydrogenase
MKFLVLGSGMMGQAIAYDLCNYSNFENITIADKYDKNLKNTYGFLNEKDIDFKTIDVDKTSYLKKFLKKYDMVISAVPYRYNYKLAKLTVDTKTHFLDLGGNNDIVKKERTLMAKAKENNVTIIPDCGLAPGMTSVITRDIVDTLNNIDYVKIRVGGLPIKPKPPLNYQIVFSPLGLINEYVEDAIILDNGKIITKKSMEEIEDISFKKPFDNLEAFLTSGGCSTLPYTYKNKIGFLDYKTIRYKGHCKKFKELLNKMDREKLISHLEKTLPSNEKDVVLIKVFSKGKKNDSNIELIYSLVDGYDTKNKVTSMMRTTAYPTSIIAIMIEKQIIDKKGVFCPEEIVPCKPFFKDLNKRNIKIEKTIK